LEIYSKLLQENKLNLEGDFNRSPSFLSNENGTIFYMDFRNEFMWFGYFLHDSILGIGCGEKQTKINYTVGLISHRFFWSKMKFLGRDQEIQENGAEQKTKRTRSYTARQKSKEFRETISDTAIHGQAKNRVRRGKAKNTAVCGQAKNH